MPGSRLNDAERRVKERWNRSNASPHNTLRKITTEGNPGLRGINPRGYGPYTIIV
jgi:hypothetical protein